ncbi:type II toxin-antitoxin system HipA family toxin [Gordonia sp. ABSL49_1]|uniref:type II toxin-antitoxin system HipA family toxin n=1 Tax=Gordonia sp. ABSL49_1 TaxID=2920941 RepID=UPI001F104B49|nr:HipA domain-containing protein [Gordonia sp. ABSL49_1]MCH5643478.1 HipA domain-containing protein [Gordonia sp. ABSL49_1]
MADETSRLAVLLHDKKIGYLRYSQNYSWFEFDDDYIDDPNRNVLGLRFEESLSRRVSANLRLPPWFSNLLPEGQLRTWIAIDRGVSKDREIQLLGQVGHDLPGAVRVLEPEADDTDVPSDMQAPTYAGASGAGWRFSLAGIGLKFSMLRDAGRFTCPASGEGGDWIVKLPDREFPHVPANEYHVMTLARISGLDVPETRLVHREDIKGLPASAWPGKEEWAYAIRRFDRTAGGTRVHMEDLAQVRGVYPEDKYFGNFESLGGLVFRGHDTKSLREFARRLAFFVLVGNGDAHLKNWSLLYKDPRTPVLSPLYDAVCTELYRPQLEGNEDLGLRLGGTRRFDRIKLRHFARIERKLGATTDLESIVAGYVRSVQESWPAVEAEIGDSVPGLRSTLAGLIGRRAAQLIDG